MRLERAETAPHTFTGPNMYQREVQKYHKHFRAEDGGKGGKDTKHGKNADDIRIDVPIGTVVKDAQSGNVICELTEDGQEFILV